MATEIQLFTVASAVDAIEDKLGDGASLPVAGTSLRCDVNGESVWRPDEISDIVGLEAALSGAGQVTSVFGRIGAIDPEVDDYSAFYSQLSHTHTFASITSKPT